MPEYSYICRNCREEHSVVQRMAEAKPHHRCPKCKGMCRRVFKAPQLKIFKEFVTADITGEPTRVSSFRQEQELCAANGVMSATKEDMRGLKPKQAAMQHSLYEDYCRTKQEMGA